ncbi:hypothetical protein [Elizabethkingia miricola]|uniref:hypothetical protein n=1 Tax=Elizabethkingia miricola TaxID=172045 RepID=UPI003892A648
MKNIDLKQIAIYGGLALLAYKIFNTKVTVSTNLQPTAGTGTTTTPTGTTTGGSTIIPISETPLNSTITDSVAMGNNTPVNTNPNSGTYSDQDKVLNAIAGINGNSGINGSLQTTGGFFL